MKWVKTSLTHIESLFFSPNKIMFVYGGVLAFCPSNLFPILDIDVADKHAMFVRPLRTKSTKRGTLSNPSIFCRVQRFGSGSDFSPKNPNSDQKLIFYFYSTK